MDNEQFTPKQVEGAQTDAVENRIFDVDLKAAEFYEVAKNRLLCVMDWHKISTIKASVFCLTDLNGKEVNRPAWVGDFIKIDIPGPGSTAGEGFDWVKVEHIEEKVLNELDQHILLMRVRPSAMPGANENDAAHFFKHNATSTFIVSRKGNELSAEVHGRNEMANVDTPKLLDKARNVIVASGSFLGISILQWKVLVKGILNS
ncbi:hypothetical protein [Pedobacter nototheniae]|uniref:hypothetical protein n=1 Tax=Pedobacter nototheniae TaxID=2488994 RepID=UPI0029303CC6|nr:hypothetical protein [Pedobacter nototheniae]